MLLIAPAAQSHGPSFVHAPLVKIGPQPRRSTSYTKVPQSFDRPIDGTYGLSTAQPSWK